MTDRPETCQNCRWWSDESDLVEGECRKQAPQFMDGDQSAIWPVTMPTDWCGEFARKE